MNEAANTNFLLIFSSPASAMLARNRRVNKSTCMFTSVFMEHKRFREAPCTVYARKFVEKQRNERPYIHEKLGHILLLRIRWKGELIKLYEGNNHRGTVDTSITKCKVK